MCMFWLSFSFCMMVQCCFIIFDQQFSEKKFLGPYIDQNLHHSYRLKGPDFAFSQISGFPVTGGSWFGFFSLMWSMGQANIETGGENKFPWVLRTTESLKAEKMTKKREKRPKLTKNRHFYEILEPLVCGGQLI